MATILDGCVTLSAGKAAWIQVPVASYFEWESATMLASSLFLTGHGAF